MPAANTQLKTTSIFKDPRFREMAIPVMDFPGFAQKLDEADFFSRCALNKNVFKKVSLKVEVKI